jgi:hypothetical protein
MIVSVRIGACLGRRSISYHTPYEVSPGAHSRDCQMSTFHTATILRPSISVREIDTPDGAALLDIRQGLCLSLNTVGAEIWHLLKLSTPLEEIADQLATKFDEARAGVLDDVKEFLDDLSQKGLLSVGNEEKRIAASKLRSALIACWRTGLHSWSTTGSASRRFLLERALISLAAFDGMGFSGDFAAMCQFVREWPTAPGPPGNEAVNRVCKAVNYACVWYPKRVLCLQRSAVTTCLLRASGVPAQMVMGAQKFPFKAHAWTEVNGSPINERRDVRNAYLLWERC